MSDEQRIPGTGEHNTSAAMRQHDDEMQVDQIAQAAPQEVMPSAQLKALYDDCKKSLDKNLEEFEPLRKLNDLTNILCARLIAKDAPLSDEQSKFIYDELLAGVARRIVNVKTTNELYADLVSQTIQGFVSLLSTELQMQTKTCEDLCDALRMIWSVADKFYQNQYKKEVIAQAKPAASGTGASDASLSISERLSQDEITWRNSLKKGDMIDAIKKDQIFEVHMWTKASIETIMGVGETNLGDPSGKNIKAFLLKYANDQQTQQGYHSADASTIGPLGTYTYNEGWRDELKRGDRVDAMDRLYKWYSATIIHGEERKEGCLMPMVKVGFRVYHENGDKSDEMGRYDGLSEAQDNMIGSYTVRIQPPGTMVQERDLSGNLIPKVDNLVIVEQGSKQTPAIASNKAQDDKDMEMIQEEGQIIFTTERITCRCTMFTEMMNQFGATGGFEDILKVIAAPDTTLTHVFYLCDMLSKCQRMYHKSFVDNYFHRLADAVEQKLLSATVAQLKAVRKERIDELIEKVWKSLLLRLHDAVALEIVRGKVIVKVGIFFLKQNFLEKKIDGAKMIDGVCKKVSMVDSGADTISPGGNPKQLLIQILKDSNALDLYFSNKNIHGQLVQRTDGLLKLLIGQSALSKEEIDMIWTACQENGDATMLDLYQVLKTISSSLKPVELTFFITQIAKKTPDQVRVQEIELMQHLANMTSVTDTAVLAYNQAQVMEFLWSFLFDEKADQYLDKVLANMTVIAFSDIFKHASKDLALLYFGKIVNNLTTGKMGFLNIKIAARFFREFSKLRVETQTQFADLLNDDFHLFDLIFEELKTYIRMTKIKLAVKVEEIKETGKKVDYSKLSDKPYLDMFAHSDQLTERMNFIKDFASCGSFKITKEHLTIMWDTLTVDNPLVKDHQAFYVWLRKVSEDVLKDGKSMADQESLIAFFREKIGSDQTDFSNLSIEGYYCIQTFFVLINKQARRLIVLGEEVIPPPKKATTAPENTTGTNAEFAKQAKDNFTSYSSETGAKLSSYSFSKDTQSGGTQTGGAAADEVNKAPQMDPELIDVLVRVPPKEMEGINGLWKIAIDCQEKKVGESVTKLLLQLHTDVDFGMESQIPIFEDQFIDSCLSIIHAQIEAIDARTDQLKKDIIQIYENLNNISNWQIQKAMPVQEKRISKCLSYMKMLITNSEKDGTHSLSPHASLDQGEFLHSIKINNAVSGMTGNGYRANFIIQCFANETVFSFRKRVANELSFKQKPDGQFEQTEIPHPMQLKLNRYSGQTTLKESQNGSTLKELGFRANETLSCMSVGMYSASKFPLLNDDLTDLNERSKYVFSQMFSDYSVVDPEHPDRKIMGSEEVKKFIEGASGESSSSSDTRISGIMAWDSDDDGKITQEDFITFYKNSIFEKPDAVRKNLNQHNFRSDLRHAPKAGDPDNVLQMRKSILEMPRFKIAYNQPQFKLLFKLLDYNSEVHREAQSVIRMICTNPDMFWNVLWLNDRPEQNGKFSWEMVFNPNDIKVTMYTLEIIDSILTNTTCQVNPNTPEGVFRADWVQRFLKQGGFDQLLILLEKALFLAKDQLGKVQAASELGNTIKKFLNFMLRVTKVFIWAAIKACKTEEQAEQLHLLRKHSSVQEAEKNEKKVQKEKKKAERAAAKDTEGFKDQEKTTASSKYDGPVSTLGSRDGFIGPMPPAANISKEDKDAIEAIFGETGDAGTGKKEEDDMEEAIEESKKCFVWKEPDEPPAKDGNEDFGKDEFEQSKRFKEIVEQIRNSEIASDIVKSIDFKDLQNKLLEILAIFLEKKENKEADSAIICSALALWSASLIENQQLIDEFYKWNRPAKSEDDLIKTSEDLLLSGIYSQKGYLVRDGFSQNLELVCEKVTENEGLRPLFFMIKLLQNNFPHPDSRIPTKESGYFFSLLSALILQYQAFESEQPEGAADDERTPRLDFKVMLIESLNRMKAHESSEAEGAAVSDDKTLIGLTDLCYDLLDMYINKAEYEELVQFAHDHKLLHEFFYELLYYMPTRTTSLNQNKCKGKTSRTRAYNILSKLIKAFRPKEMCEFLELYLWPMIQDLSRPKTWRHQPSDKRRSTQGFSGIKNYGCICYMISMIQQFYMVPQFRYSLLKAVDNTPPDMQEYKGRTIDDNMLRQFQKLFGFLELSERQHADPFDFCFAFKDEGQPTNLGVQKDANEFLSIFFDRMETQLKPTSQKYLMQDVFQGSQVNQNVCMSCGNTKTNIEEFYTLTLEVMNNQNVNESLKKMMDGEIIQDYKCDGCNQSVDLKKRSLLGRTPNVLILHLKRFEFNFNTFQNEKVNTRFEFPTLLDLNKYSFRTHNGENGEKFEDEVLNNLIEKEDDDFIYRLVGVNIHRGSAQHGHYWSLININRGTKEKDGPVWGKVEEDIWKAFDDDEVRFQSYSNIAGESYGGDATGLKQDEIDTFLSEGSAYGKSSYMLVYERKTKGQIREIKVKGEVTEADKWVKDKNRDKVAEGLAKVQDADRQMADLERRQEEPAATTTHESGPAPAAEQTDVEMEAPVADEADKVGEQFTEMVDWKEIPNFVPEWINDMVRQDNTEFMIDRQVFHTQFFHLVKLVLKHIANNLVMSQHTYGYEYSQYFYKMKSMSLQIAQKVMFDFLTHFHENANMQPITEAMSSIFTFSDSYISFTRLQEPSILCEFVQKYYIEDSCTYLFEILFNCPDVQARFNIASVTSGVINKLFRIVGVLSSKEDTKDNAKVVKAREFVDVFMNLVMPQLHERDSQRNWTRLVNFYTMIFDIGTGGRYETEYLLQSNDIVVDLCDLMLQQKSPKALDEPQKRVEMGGSVNPASFGPIVALASHLVCSMHTEQIDPQSSTFTKFRDETDLNAPLTSLTEKFMITEDAVQYFTNPDLIAIIMNNEYESVKYGKALAHLCFGNRKLSKQICELVLRAIVVSDYQKIDSYLNVVKELVQTQDFDEQTGESLQKKRLEWIFGFAYLNHIQPGEKMKIGLDSLYHNIRAEVYTYKSMLTYDPDNNNSLLHLLWRYQGKMENYVMNCLGHLGEIITSDEAIMEFFSELPGVTYQYARYTDWIMPYLSSTLNKATSGYSSSGVSKDDIVKMLSQFEVYEAYLHKKDAGEEPMEGVDQAKESQSTPQQIKVDFNYLKKPGAEADDATMKNEEEKIDHPEEEEKKADDTDMASSQLQTGGCPPTTAGLQGAEDEEMVNIMGQEVPASMVLGGSSGAPGTATVKPLQLSQTVIKCTPEPYVICETKDETYLNVLEHNGLLLSMSYFACSYVVSQPTGYNNLSVSQEFQDKYKPSIAISGKSAAAMLAERNEQMAANDRTTGVTGYIGNSTALRMKKSPSMEARPDQEMQGTAVRQENVADLLAARNTEWGDVPNTTVASHGTAEENRVEQSKGKGKNASGVGDTSLPIVDADKGAENVPEEIPSSALDDSFEDWNGSELKTSSDLVYKMTLNNTMGDKIQFKIKLRPVSAAELPNLRWPRNGIKGSLGPNETSTVALLQKILPDEGMGNKAELEKLEVKVTWKLQQTKSSSKPANTGKSVSFDNDVRQVSASNVVNQGTDGSTQANDAGTDTPFDPALYEGSAADEKNCPACTMLNPISATVCFVCQTNFN